MRIAEEAGKGECCHDSNHRKKCSPIPEETESRRSIRGFIGGGGGRRPCNTSSRKIPGEEEEEEEEEVEEERD